MTVSDAIGSFDWLSIWNLSPVMAAGIVLVADFGLVNLLMWYEGYPRRGRYLNFIVNDALLYPVAAAMATIILRDAAPSDAWYTDALWQWACLLGPLVVSVGLEIQAVKDGMFTPAQERSPSKLAHTLVFAAMGYWILAPIPAVIDTVVVQGTGPVLPFVIWAGCLALAIPLALSGKIVYWFGSRVEPHIEWHWRILQGLPRRHGGTV